MPLRYLRPLRIASVVFLSIPWLIFDLTWLRPAWAAALLLLHGWVLATYAKTSERADAVNANDAFATPREIPVRSLVLLVVIALAWVSLSGAGGVGWQNLPDWNNKNLLMNDMLLRPWPPGYEGGQVLNYYFALYFPAVAVGRVLGWSAGQWVLYLEVLAGTLLALLWVFSFSRSWGIRAVFLFVGFGGLDIVGFVVFGHRLPRPGGPIEWWTPTLQFSSVTTLLYWVPQHCLPGWLLTALLLDDAIRLRRVTFAGFFGGLCVLWSPFVTLGLVPIVIAAFLLAERKSLVSVANLAWAPLLALLAVAFYAPHGAGGDLDASADTWMSHFSPGGLYVMARFLALEVAVYAVFVALCWRRLERPWRVLAITVAVASVVWVLPPENVGHGNFTMRSSIPVLLVLFLLVIRVMDLLSRPMRLALLACLALGAVSALQETTRSVQRYPAQLPAPRPAKGVMDLSPRHRNEFLMPSDSRLYRLVFRDPRE